MIRQTANGRWSWGESTETFASYLECLESRKGFFKIMAAEVRHEGKGKFTFTLSSPGVDRDHDTVNQLGIDLTEFKKNPVVMWAHDYKIPPVGRVEATWIRDGKLMGSISFPPKGISPLADTLHGLVEHGYLNAVSVGFTPVEVLQRADGGMDYVKIELMELSLVPVPSNRDALILAEGKGVNVKTVKDWASAILAKEDSVEIHAVLARIEKDAILTRAQFAELVAGLKGLVEELKAIDAADVEDEEEEEEEEVIGEPVGEPAKKLAGDGDVIGEPVGEPEKKLAGDGYVVGEPVGEPAKKLDDVIGEPVGEPAKDRAELNWSETNLQRPEEEEEDEDKKALLSMNSKQITELAEAFRLVSLIQRAPQADVPSAVPNPPAITSEQLLSMVKEAVELTVQSAVRQHTGRLD